MKKQFLTYLIALSLAVGVFTLPAQNGARTVEALPDSGFCNALNSSVSSTVDFTMTNCQNLTKAGKVLFTFEYNYRVTGLSSGTDGY